MANSTPTDRRPTAAIIDTAYGGSGVAKDSEGKAIFIPHTVTGDTVEWEAVKEHPSYSEARLVKVLEPSPHRIAPACPYAGVCGGCSFRHISYPYQLIIKESILKNALRKLAFPPVEVAASHTEGYRIRVTIRVRGDSVGFYRENSRQFVPIEHCPNLPEELFNTLKLFKGGTGSVSALMSPDKEVAVRVEGEGIIPPNGVSTAFLLYKTGAGEIPVEAGGFFQSNRFLIDTLGERAARYANQAGGRTLELYAGSGFFTKALKNVTAVEGNKAASDLARRFGLPVIYDSVESFLKSVKGGFDTIFLDPPREGVSGAALADITRIKPKQIVYVSCNPMTLARDLGKLSPLYAIEALTLFDMFVHSFHIETLAVLKLRD